MCSSAETSCCSSTSSPSRISFSFSFCQLLDHENAIPPQQLHQISSSSSDFDFGVTDCCRSSFDNEFSSADQLFKNGTILPVEMMMIMRNNEETSCELGLLDQDSNYLQPLPFLSPLYSSPPVNNKTETAAETETDHDVEKVQSKSTSSSFWGFKRSSSCNTSVNNSKNNLSFLFPIPVLPKNNIHQQQSAPKMVKSSSLSSTASRRPQVQLRKSRSSGAGSYSIKVSPVLHFRAPNCICRAAKTPGFLGCFFSARGSSSNGNKKKT